MHLNQGSYNFVKLSVYPIASAGQSGETEAKKFPAPGPARIAIETKNGLRAAETRYPCARSYDNIVSQRRLLPSASERRTMGHIDLSRDKIKYLAT